MNKTVIISGGSQGIGKALVKKFLTAEYARQLFGEDQYYQIILKDDTMLKAILK